jgi:Ca-activated chloride channel family protein
MAAESRGIAATALALSGGVAALCALPAALVRHPDPPPQAPVFRAATDAAWVTATAIDRDGRLVTDLGRDDFEILEDGVMQPITVFHSDAVPFAIAVMFDVSGSMDGNVGLMRRSLDALIANFRPGDRANVGTFDTLPSMSPRFSSHRETLLRSATTSGQNVTMPCSGPWMTESWRHGAPGWTAVWDAVACAIDAVAADAETPRRVVLLVTDGVDYVSTTTQFEAERRADEYGVMVYVIALSGFEGLNSVALRGLASATGGGYFVLNQQNDLSSTFARIGEELRRQYVLGYSGGAMTGPRGRLQVRVKRPDIVVRARRATMTTTPVAPVVTAAVNAERERRALAPDASAPGAVSDSIFDRSARGELSAADLPRLSLNGLRTAVNEIRRAGPIWIRAAGSETEAVRRLQLATFVLEFLSRQDDAYYWTHHRPASELLLWAGELLRGGPTRPEERIWYLAATALLQRFGAADGLEHHVNFARSRFPDEPRFALARAVADELRTWPERRDERGFDVAQPVLLRLLGRFTEAMQIEAVAQEARLRLGYFELRRGRVAQALTYLDAAGAPQDEALRYLRHLFRGQALERTGRLEEAAAAFSEAFDTVPYAESATLALAASWVRLGRHADASALVSRMLVIGRPPLDPWTYYTFPEWRFWPEWMDALRQASRS